MVYIFYKNNKTYQNKKKQINKNEILYIKKAFKKI